MARSLLLKLDAKPDNFTLDEEGVKIHNGLGASGFTLGFKHKHGANWAYKGIFIKREDFHKLEAMIEFTRENYRHQTEDTNEPTD